MAIYYQHHNVVEVVGYHVLPGQRYALCCRYTNGQCVLASLDDLQADDGLHELAAAYHAVLGYDPWNRYDALARL